MLTLYQDNGPVTMIHLAGSFFAETVETIGPAMDRLASQARSVGLNLSQVDQLDSSGLGAIVLLISKIFAADKDF